MTTQQALLNFIQANNPDDREEAMNELAELLEEEKEVEDEKVYFKN